jgi:hypothetical protein
MRLHIAALAILSLNQAVHRKCAFLQIVDVRPRLLVTLNRPVTRSVNRLIFISRRAA